MSFSKPQIIRHVRTYLGALEHDTYSQYNLQNLEEGLTYLIKREDLNKQDLDLFILCIKEHPSLKKSLINFFEQITSEKIKQCESSIITLKERARILTENVAIVRESIQ